MATAKSSMTTTTRQILWLSLMMISLYETLAFSSTSASSSTLRLRPSHRRVMTTTLPFQKRLFAVPGFEFLQQATSSLSTTSSSLSAASFEDASSSATAEDDTPLSPLESTLVRCGLCLYIASICLVLPLMLLPQAALFQLHLISRRRKELWAWKSGQACCKWLLRLIPFMKLECQPAIMETLKDDDISHNQEPQACVWVCNHTSMLDVFVLLAADAVSRGGGKDQKKKNNNKTSSLHRPIKIVYWKQLEDNFVTKLLFRQAGFLSVDMAANGHGQANEYDKRTFKTLLQQCKQALQQDKFDIGILPEGQLNPNTAQGLLPIFPGAYTLAKMCHTPIGMMALHGIDQLWHPIHGMQCRQRRVRVRCYPFVRHYTSAEEFVQTFTHVVGHFGAVGRDVEDWQVWMNGSLWKERQQQQEQLEKLESQQEQPSKPEPTKL